MREGGLGLRHRSFQSRLRLEAPAGQARGRRDPCFERLPGNTPVGVVAAGVQDGARVHGEVIAVLGEDERGDNGGFVHVSWWLSRRKIEMA